MIRNSLITILLLTTTLVTAGGKTKNQSVIEKKVIDIERVDRIEISKQALSPDTTKSIVKVLSNEQVKSFIGKWNQIDNLEPRIYMTSYNLTWTY